MVVYGDADADVDRDRECGWVSLDLFRLGLNMDAIIYQLIIIIIFEHYYNIHIIYQGNFYILIFIVFIYLW